MFSVHAFYICRYLIIIEKASRLQFFHVFSSSLFLTLVAFGKDTSILFSYCVLRVLTNHSLISFAEESDKYLPSLAQSQTSVEYLICTQINGDESSLLSSSPLIGFRVTELPCYLLALSLSGEFTVLPLTSTTLVRRSKALATATPPCEEDEQVWIQNSKF